MGRKKVFRVGFLDDPSLLLNCYFFMLSLNSCGKSPVVCYEQLSTALGINLYVKHDDYLAGAGGGNKVRKLRYIMPAAAQRGCNALVTTGSAQSNHVRAAALMAAQLGWHARILIHEAEPEMYLGNLLIAKLAGSEISYCRREDVANAMDQAMEELVERGLNPLYIWGGGHCMEGAYAFYEAADELMKQCEGGLPDIIVHASGTGTTQAGLVAGFHGTSIKVIGVSVAHDASRGASVVRDSLNQLGRHLKADYSRVSLQFRDEWREGGYGKVSERLIATIRWAGKCGLLLDPTYTGKAFLGLEDMVASGEIPQGGRILFWHTGGLLNLLSSPHFVS
jgi:1-aminocyclopropane-1-carboxylate deaminase/D-cysteine desulfhydrase-like pyridoxal-dependent ACC family enzyme